jgi:hypothetical protein
MATLNGTPVFHAFFTGCNENGELRIGAFTHTVGQEELIPTFAALRSMYERLFLITFFLTQIMW